MGFISIRKGRPGPKFLHLLNLKNMRVIFSKDDSGVRVEVCETKDKPPYMASLKFSFYISEEEYRKITKKHNNIVSRMMRDLEELSRTIEEMYRRKRNAGKQR